MIPKQQPISLDETPPESVIEFGSPPTPRRRFTGSWRGAGFGRGASFGRGLAADRRVAPLAALLGAVAVFASLISEWQVTAVDGTAYGSGEVGEKLIPADVADLGAFGAGYLAGLFLLVATVVLTMFGPVAGRRYARLAGLSIGGTLLGMLAALTSLLGDQSRIISRLYTLDAENDQLKLSYGRGLWCALFGVLAALVALYAAGRHTQAVAEPPAAAEPVTEEPAAGWSWRRPRTGDHEMSPNEPFELTVSSAPPFTPPADDRDKPR